MKRSLPTKILHGLLAAAVIHQLLVSLVMHRPRPSNPGGSSGYGLHQTVGLIALGILIAFWLWTLIRRRENGFADLVPWFSAVRLRAVTDDLMDHLHALRHGHLPVPREETPLASAIHGLGLLVATALAVSGTIIFVMMGTDGSISATGHLVMEFHSLLANLMWAYLIGHPAIALLHEAMGHRILQNMFSA